MILPGFLSGGKQLRFPQRPFTVSNYPVPTCPYLKVAIREN